MLPPRTSRRLPIIIVAALMLAAGIAVALHARARPDRLGLFTTLPILWAEAATVRDMLHDDASPHWAKAVLERRGVIEPLDALADGAGRSRLDGLELLVMAQPRPLSPAENVALDRWVRRGGHLLLFADPMLTGGTAFALGDKRRPQDVVLLSPILHRWGLMLRFDDVQSPGEHVVSMMGISLPVNLPGTLEIEGRTKACSRFGEGLAVQCAIGQGKLLVIADAALLETGEEPAKAMRLAALDQLLAQITP